VSVGARARAIGRAAFVLAMFYVSFGLLLYAGTILEWAALEGLRAARAFELVHGWASVARGLLPLTVPGLLAAGVLYWALTRFFHRPPASWGWPHRPGRRLVEGAVWGVALALVTLLVCLAGGARVTGEAGAGLGYLAVGLPVLGGLALAALLEELLFRGFPLVRLAEAAGRTGAALTLALAFALMHAWNPDLSLLGVLNIGVASLLLSAVFLAGGGLAGAWGLHTGWNAGLALGADAPVSGLAFRLPAIAYDPGPREWLTGGGFGPEGGLAATAVLGAVTVWWGRRALTPATEAAA
jgi:membrane protease YdiL (CAAX protease family)